MMPSLLTRNPSRLRANGSDSRWLASGHGDVEGGGQFRLRAIACLLSIVSLGFSCRSALSADMMPTTRRQSAIAPEQLATQQRLSAAGGIALSGASTPMTSPPPTSVSESERVTDPQLPAPSVIWLIVMPAVPIVGGVLIYLSRRLLGKAHGENRLITHAPIPDAVKPKDPAPPTDP